MDLLCHDDLDPYGRELSDDAAILWQDLYHRLIEDAGSNIDDPDRGVGVVSALSGTASPALIAHRIEADFRKDERVNQVRADVGIDGKITVYVVAVDGATLGFDVSADAVRAQGVPQ